MTDRPTPVVVEAHAAAYIDGYAAAEPSMMRLQFDTLDTADVGWDAARAGHRFTAPQPGQYQITFGKPGVEAKVIQAIVRDRAKRWGYDPTLGEDLPDWLAAAAGDPNLLADVRVALATLNQPDPHDHNPVECLTAREQLLRAAIRVLAAEHAEESAHADAEAEYADEQLTAAARALTAATSVISGGGTDA